VNPVLREGNSDRRSPLSVKAFARKNPHKLSAWSPDSKTHVAHMTADDFYGSENSTTIRKATDVRYEFVAADGTVTVLKKKLGLVEGEILDTSVMRVQALPALLRSADRRCQEERPAAVAAHQVHDDESLRPGHVRQP